MCICLQLKKINHKSFQFEPFQRKQNKYVYMYQSCFINMGFNDGIIYFTYLYVSAWAKCIDSEGKQIQSSNQSYNTEVCPISCSG